MNVGVGVLQCGGTLTEVHHEAKVVVLGDRAFEVRAQAADQKFAAGWLRFRKIGTPIGLHIAADTQVVAVVLGMNKKSIRTKVDYRASQGFLARGALLLIELAIDDLDLLIEMLKLGVCRLQCFNFLLELSISFCSSACDPVGDCAISGRDPSNPTPAAARIANHRNRVANHRNRTIEVSFLAVGTSGGPVSSPCCF
jgi:hypothetical protein